MTRNSVRIGLVGFYSVGSFHPIIWQAKQYANILSLSNLGDTGGKLTMSKNRSLETKRNMIQRQTLASVKGCCIDRSAEKLPLLHSPANGLWLKLESNPRKTNNTGI